MDRVVSEASPQQPRHVRTGTVGLGVLLIAVVLQLGALARPSCYAGTAACDAPGPERPAATARIASPRS